jgi:hypothetical protein
VCPAGIDYYKNSHLRVAFVCCSGAIVWPSVGIVLASAVHWLLTKSGAIFARNSKFHIRMAIWCQFRDSVTPALKKTLLPKIHKGGFILRVRRICDVAFNIAISSQRQLTSSLTIASENVRCMLSQQSWNYFNFLAISLPSLSNCHLKS